MDANIVVVVVVVIFALVTVAGFVAYRRHGSATLKAGPLQMEFTGEESTAPAPGPKVKMTDVKAGKDVLAHDRTGSGVDLTRTTATRGDVKAIVDETGTDPKALPPT